MEDELTPEEKKMFAEMPTSEVPPLSLENRVVDRLRADGLISGRAYSISSYFKWAGALAASVILFMAGWYSHGTDPEFDYVLLLHGSDNVADDNSGSRYREYGDWARRVVESGSEITGEKLSDRAAILTAESLADTTSTMGGFFMVRATSKERAIDLARSSPHIKYGGTVEIREIVRQ